MHASTIILMNCFIRASASTRRGGEVVTFTSARYQRLFNHDLEVRLFERMDSLKRKTKKQRPKKIRI